MAQKIDLWGEVAQLMDEHILPREKPPGSFTTREYCLQFGTKSSTTRKQLQAKVDRGELEMGQFVDSHSITNWYRLRKK